MKKIAYGLVWLYIAMMVLLAMIGLSIFWLKPFTTKSLATNDELVHISAPLATSALPAETVVLGETADARIPLVQNFLERHQSPLVDEDNFASTLIEIADRNGIDFRLLAAIAMQESNLCKVIPPDSYNCLGLGVHAKGTWGFNSYEENFEAAARILKKNYIDQGLTTPEQIMTKYTPSSNGSWAESVNQWMAEMRFDDREKGRTEKSDANLLEFVEDDQAVDSSTVTKTNSAAN